MRSKPLSLLLICQLAVQPALAQHTSPLLPLAKEFVVAAADLAQAAEPPLLGSPLLDQARDENLTQDIRHILMTPTRKEAVDTGRESGQIWKWVEINGADAKFQKITQRLALDRAVENLTLYSVLAGQPLWKTEISAQNYRYFSQVFPRLDSQLKIQSAQFRVSQLELLQLRLASARALVWAGFEIGALAKKATDLKLRLVEIESLLPDANQQARASLINERQQSEEFLFALQMEMDSRLAQHPVMNFLASPYQGQEVPLYVWLYEQSESLGETFSLQDPRYQLIESLVLTHILDQAPALAAQTGAFIENLIRGGTGSLAPLASLRMESLDLIQAFFTNPEFLSTYPAGQPPISKFDEANSAIERRYGFEQGKYNAYTAEDLFNVVTSGLVAAELAKFASQLKWVAGLEKGLQSAATRLAKGKAGPTVARWALARGAARWAGRGLSLGGRFLGGPVIWIGSTLPVVYDISKWADRKMYRSYLKEFVPQSFVAGVSGYHFTQVAQEMDDRVADIVMVAEVVTTLMLANRFRSVSWLQKAQEAGQTAARGGRLLSRGASGFLYWSRMALSFDQRKYQILTSALKSAGVSGLGALRGIGSKLTPKMLWRAAKRNASHMAFIGGSVSMGAEVHFVDQGFGHFGVNAWNHSESFGEFLSILWSQLKTVWGSNPQAQADLVSIGLADGVLTYGSINPAHNMISLGHLYGWVSVGSDLAGQVALDQIRHQGDVPLSESVERVDWTRALIHYSFVTTFSTYKQLFVYIPILNRMMKPMILRGITGPTGRLLVRASESQILSRQIALSLARAQKGSALWFSHYMLSLGSNWVGNKSFIDIATVLRKNSTTANRDLDREILEKTQAAFEEAGLVFDEVALHRELDALRKYQADLSQMKSALYRARAAELNQH